MSAKTTTLKTEFSRREIVTSIAVGLASALYAIIGSITFASDAPEKFLLGAVTGIVGALVASWFAFQAARSGELIWIGRAQ